jgi:thymidylate synthase (FAD)
MINEKIKVLDHGYVQLVESYGTDESIIEAAKMSTQKEFRGWDNGESKLLKFLYDHKHMTPFEMCGMIIQVKAPIFVFREWHRHRTQSYNEMSARYIPLPNENYVPEPYRVVAGSKKTANKQASGSKEIDEETAITFCDILVESYAKSQNFYEDSIERGVPKELARLCLPVGRYSAMRASANLRNWLAFLTLRMDKSAQWEIRQYANAVGELIGEQFPRTWELFIGEK